MITCRRANEDDTGLFRAIRLHALEDSPDAFGSTYEKALERDEASWRKQLLSTVTGDERNTQFAFSGDACVGLAAVYREAGASVGELLMMWIMPEFRGSGAASLLVSRLLSWASGVGISSIDLDVTDTNGRAIAFYEKQGFCRTGEEVEVDPSRSLRGIRMSRTLEQ